ncbi:MAG TPA: MotA/TolQ/ExbB proton channel family protein [Chryseolinea sp.]
MYDIYLAGGTLFMHPLSLILFINLGLIIFVVVTNLQKKKLNRNFLEAIRQLGGLAFAWGAFSTLIGLFFAFDALEAMKETLPLAVIMGGLKVALITVLYGLIIFIFSLISFIGLRAMTNNSSN